MFARSAPTCFWVLPGRRYQIGGQIRPHVKGQGPAKYRERVESGRPAISLASPRVQYARSPGRSTWTRVWPEPGRGIFPRGNRPGCGGRHQPHVSDPVDGAQFLSRLRRLVSLYRMHHRGGVRGGIRSPAVVGAGGGPLRSRLAATVTICHPDGGAHRPGGPGPFGGGRTAAGDRRRVQPLFSAGRAATHPDRKAGEILPWRVPAGRRTASGGQPTADHGGIGDLVPVTLAGRLLAAVIAVLGIGLFALPDGIISAGMLNPEMEDAGKEGI